MSHQYCPGMQLVPTEVEWEKTNGAQLDRNGLIAERCGSKILKCIRKTCPCTLGSPVVLNRTIVNI